MVFLLGGICELKNKNKNKTLLNGSGFAKGTSVCTLRGWGRKNTNEKRSFGWPRGWGEGPGLPGPSFPSLRPPQPHGSAASGLVSGGGAGGHEGQLKAKTPCATRSGAERNGVKGATWRRQPSAFGVGAGKASRVTEPQGAGSFQGTYFLWPLGTDRLRGTGSGREPAQLGSPPPALNTSQHKRPSGFMVYGWQSVGTRSLSSRQKSAVASRSWEVTHGGLIQATQLEKAVSQ